MGLFDSKKKKDNSEGIDDIKDLFEQNQSEKQDEFLQKFGDEDEQTSPEVNAALNDLVDEDEKQRDNLVVAETPVETENNKEVTEEDLIADDDETLIADEDNTETISADETETEEEVAQQDLEDDEPSVDDDFNDDEPSEDEDDQFTPIEEDDPFAVTKEDIANANMPHAGDIIEQEENSKVENEADEDVEDDVNIDNAADFENDEDAENDGTITTMFEENNDAPINEKPIELVKVNDNDDNLQQQNAQSLHYNQDTVFEIEASFADWFLHDLKKQKPNESLERRKLYAINYLTKSYLVSQLKNKNKDKNYDIDNGGFFTLYEDYINKNVFNLIDAVRMFNGTDSNKLEDNGNWKIVNSSSYFQELILIAAKGKDYIKTNHASYEDAVDRMIKNIADDNIRVDFN